MQFGFVQSDSAGGRRNIYVYCEHGEYHWCQRQVYGISNCSGITSASVVMKAVATTDTLNGMYLSTGVKGDIKAELYNCNAAM